MNVKNVGQLPEWLGHSLTLDIDHINENWLDDRLENLRFLCPNCHSQFSRNLLGLKPKYIPKRSKYTPVKSAKKIKIIDIKCLNCENNVNSKRSKYCSQDCAHKVQRKIEWTSVLLVEQLIKHKANMTQIAKELNVSDNLVRKQCKNFAIDFQKYK